uniref:Uncharacterized protein n=1 Tax=viral metagenome TaxID=1070528 RepID=A0A6C0CQ12_9ZZZZ
MFCDMIGELVNVFPRDSELRLYKFAVESAISTDIYFISRIFNEYVAIPYCDKIETKDETFFMEKDYKEYTGGDQGMMDIFGKLKYCWKDLNEDNRTIIWKYLRVILNLNNKIYQ